MEKVLISVDQIVVWNNSHIKFNDIPERCDSIVNESIEIYQLFERTRTLIPTCYLRVRFEIIGLTIFSSVYIKRDNIYVSELKIDGTLSFFKGELIERYKYNEVRVVDSTTEGD